MCSRTEFSIPPRWCRRRFWLGAVLALAAPACLAVTSRIEIGAIETPALTARDLQADLQWDSRDRLQLSFSAAEVSLASGRRFQDVKLNCGEADWQGDRLFCRDGSLATRVAGKSPLRLRIDLSYRLTDGYFDIRAQGIALAKGTAQIELTGTAAAWQVQGTMQNVDLTELRKLVEQFHPWPKGYSDESGSIDAKLQASGRQGDVDKADVTVQARALSFNGPAIADHADMLIHIKLAGPGTAKDYRLDVDTSLNKGAVYFEPGFTVRGYRPGITLEVADKPITALATARFDPATNRLQLDHFQFDQPSVLRVTGSADLAMDSDTAMQALKLKFQDVPVKQFYATYLQPLCAHIEQLCGLEMAGQVSGELNLDDKGIHELSLDFGDVYLDDAGNRFRFADLKGRLVLNSGDQPAQSQLRWKGAGLYRLNFGEGAMTMISSHRTLKVTQWSDLRVLGGQMKIQTLELKKVGTPDFAMKMEGVLTPVSMEDFCQTMGWPIMSGKLSGVIPGLEYTHGTLTLAGDFLMRMFDGSVVVHDLKVENLFSADPVLTTNIDIHNLDLEQLTHAFSFGKIEGKLDGQIHGMRLEDWSPVAFDAKFETPPDDHSTHRISQRAVENLSSIGTGGVMGALSTGYLKVFKNYSYDRLGISCVLKGGFCTMDGIAPAPDGDYYIVTRGGMLPPWIDVKGTGRRVAWSDLVFGLKRIANGNASIQ